MTGTFHGTLLVLITLVRLDRHVSSIQRLPHYPARPVSPSFSIVVNWLTDRGYWRAEYSERVSKSDLPMRSMGAHYSDDVPFTEVWPCQFSCPYKPIIWR